MSRVLNTASRGAAWWAGLFVLSLLLAGTLAGAEPQLSARWVFLQLNLQRSEDADRAQQILRRAAAAGYNGVVLADYKLNVLNRVPDFYFRNVERVKTLAAELRLELIPAVAPFGYSEGILTHAPDLAEGLPVKDAPLVVRDGVGRLATAGRNLLPGGGFEEYRGHTAAGWSFQDFPGQASFIDREVRHSGQAALRFENLGQTSPRAGNGRVSQGVRVVPWRQYHAAVWIKTQDFDRATDVRMFALGQDGRTVSYANLGVKPEQDWTEHHVVFNSLENEELRFYCGAWGGKQGLLWLDDVRLEEVALVNLLRRDGCPLTVTGPDGQPLTEGQDFAPLVDRRMGRVPWPGSFDNYHEPPLLQILPGARIANGQTLRVSYYHAVTVYDRQVACCLAAPQVFTILEDQVRRVDKLLAPQTYFLSHDEIRVANWCGACQQAGRTAGQLLAENVRHCVALVRRVNPTARLAIWSDMFDPHHNAVDQYYLVNGTLAGAWEGLPPEVLVVNWNHGQAAQSLPWFGQRGHGQVLAGYYDGDPKSITAWLGTADSASRVQGAMYTTWRSNFDHLEAFARAAWGP